MLKKVFKDIGQFFKGYASFMKLALWYFIMEIMFSIFSLAFFSTGENASEWLILLSVLMVISYIAITFTLARSSAYTDFQVYKNNYIRKKKGEEIPGYKIMGEYRNLKGVWAGVLAVLPTLILIVLGLTASPVISESNTFGRIAAFLNTLFYVPVLNLWGIGTLYSLLYGCALTVAASGAGYYLHGRKLQIQFAELQKGSHK